jgi:hypothetical protein
MFNAQMLFVILHIRPVSWRQAFIMHDEHNPTTISRPFPPPAPARAPSSGPQRTSYSSGGSGGSARIAASSV